MDRPQIVHLDTHILIWLYEGRVEQLTKPARRAIEKSTPIASPAAVFELEMLHEIGKRRNTANKLISALASEIGLEICSLPFRNIVDSAIPEAWTRDPFDRLIVANAKAAGAHLITADTKIQRHYSRALW
jgi:PIN domain nuclease of toxin-antitoxin system